MGDRHAPSHPHRDIFLHEASLIPLPTSPEPRIHWFRWLWLLTTLVALTIMTLMLVNEARSSRWQAREISEYAQRLGYTLADGSSDRLVFPRHGPFDERLGYTRLPHWQQRLEERGFEVSQQVRMSPALLDYANRGFFVPYREKTQAGLALTECRGETMHHFANPQRHFAHFEEVPELVLKSLLFIENRDLLDNEYRYANPAVDWPRFVRAAVSQVGEAINLPGQSSGGSTLATQLEKYRHSPGGLTMSAQEKLRQMVSASVRAYRQGPETLTARQDVALDYLNSVPLSAAPGYGEVLGLGDGLWVWFGAELDDVILALASNETGAAALAARGQALRQVVALMIAQRRPSHYLRAGHDDLAELSASYLRLMAEQGLIDPELRDAALAQSLDFRDFQSAPVSLRVDTDKGLRLARGRLASLLDVSLYELDRLDLRASTTLNADLQHRVSAYLQRLEDPSAAAEAGLFGHHLLDRPETAAGVRYSFTLFERSDEGFQVRVQTDTNGTAFDINQDSKLELGSTAKLRVLASYLEIIAELHERYSGQPREALLRVDVDRRDALLRWVVDQLIRDPDLPLKTLLEAAMQRRYSASPYERFITGGGIHTFTNFRREDNGRRPTLEHALHQSINLPFVRLLRDLVNHHVYANPDNRRLLEDDSDPRRDLYISRFADQEGRIFLDRFWQRYHTLDAKARLVRLFRHIHTTPVRLAAAYRYLMPEQTADEFRRLLRETLSADSADNQVLDDKKLDALYWQYAPDRYSLNDRAYLSRVHPLELWLLAYLGTHPDASREEVMLASIEERQQSYAWLVRTRHRQARDSRIRRMLEVEAFDDLHRRWALLGYPFEQLVPSLATAIGSSGDRPAALAELMGIILNEGVRKPTIRIDGLHFATDTPFETRFSRSTPGVRVMAPEVAAVLRDGIIGVVEAGTARRLAGTFLLPDGSPMTVGGKTGTGDNRIETVTRTGQVTDSRARNRTATFVFFLGDRHFGTLTAYVLGGQAEDYRFTSSLPVQVLKSMQPMLAAYLMPAGSQGCRPTPAPLMMAGELSRKDA
ncbi:MULTISPECIES: transglycosylase domain-containing protein [Halomonadaceae]|uniref:transglycosylase domain-containing protein n=1 Tax=Halomonadaceae TaxID=28256 RepID=UPI001583F68C|nr:MULTISPECIES: transglycosylase domain-containing protein [Halomonas]MDI4639002.1 transglycosylase domain-containing protein [Halomonas sp. BMC7]NUJ59992.1 penicillin-binding protein [Halomonas taeanensis]